MGKGSVQGIFPLNVSGGGVRLTTAKFFSPTGKPINQVGVDADITVQQVAKSTGKPTVGQDQTLRIGIQTARQAYDKHKLSSQSGGAPFQAQYSGR